MHPSEPGLKPQPEPALDARKDQGAGQPTGTAAAGAPSRTSRGPLYWLSYLRSLVFTNIVIYATTAVLGTLSLAGSVVDAQGRWQHGCARIWGWLILKIGLIRVHVEGLERLNPTETVIFCANHPSAMDIPILLASLPVPFRFLAKRELFRLPFLGWHLRRSGHIAVERGRPREAMKSLEEAAERVRQGTPVVLFPEGTRSRRPGRMLPFKTGSFYLAIRSGVPVVPITLNGTRHVLEPDTYHVRPGRTELIIHEPIPTAGLTLDDVHTLSDRVRAAILSRFVPQQD